MNYNIEEIFNFNYNNICPNIIIGENYRISIIKDNIIRLEYSKNNIFNDKPTKKVLNRDFGEVSYEVIEDNMELKIITDKVILRYDKQKFSAEGLNILIRNIESQDCTWKFGQNDSRNLKSICRTLDDIDGRTHLEEGLISRGGFSSFDDSDQIIINQDGSIATFDAKLYTDVYYICHDSKIDIFFKDFYKMSGYPAKIDRQFLGNWWSRFWEYDDNSLKNVLTEFKANDIPLSVNVMDMDWHTVPHMKYGFGWTGFTWDKNLFPDPKKILKWQHDMGLLVALNLHPADGFRKHEEQYMAIANDLNFDTSNEDKIEFDVTNMKFMESYFKQFIHLNQDRGVDFWWLDWQHGDSSKIENLDPLWMINHLHYLDSVTSSTKPITFSRYSGLGSHRYPIGFSGDTHMTWESLAFQPEFTAKSANVGYNYWSHDIGGHFHGKMDDELYLRWIQFGVFSPILRLHSSKNKMIYKEPWAFQSDTFKIAQKYLKLRHKLIAYINTYNYQTQQTGQQLIRPLYHEDFDDYMNFEFSNSYFFGKDIIVHPITKPIEKFLNQNIQTTYLPKGKWFDESGNFYNGQQKVAQLYTLDQVPQFFRAGTILVLDHNYQKSHIENQTDLDIDLYPGNSSFDLLEEIEGKKFYSKFKSYTENKKYTLTIDSAEFLEFSIERMLKIEFIYLGKVREVHCNGSQVKFETSDRGVKFHVEKLTDYITIDIYLGNQLLVNNESKLFAIIKNFDLESHLKNEFYLNLLEMRTVSEMTTYIASLELNPILRRALLIYTNTRGANEIYYNS